MILEAKRSADEHGPGSEAGRRFQYFQFLALLTQQSHSHHRRQREGAPAPWRVPPVEDPSIEARAQLTAAEALDGPPSSDEVVIAIPPEGSDSGRGRAFLRIGIGKASWVGSFEIGDMSVSTISMMPDRKHLFVSAQGAGYIIDLKSRTLVEKVGTDVAGVMRDEPLTLFAVDHNGMSLELFGRTGRLWKTEIFSCGGIRDTAITDTTIVGEARQASPPGWVRFSVTLATGEVRFDDAV